MPFPMPFPMPIPLPFPMPFPTSDSALPRRARLLPLLLAAALAACGGGTMPAEEEPDEGGGGVGLPFSESRESGDLVYFAGALGNRPGTLEIVPGGIEPQVRQTMANLGAALERRGLDFSRVAAVNVYLSDIRHFADLNAVYREYFPEDPPTRATVEAGIAVPGALVEISMVAVKAGVERRVIRPEALKSPELPYSWGIAAGDTLFVAGATARDPDTYQPVAGGVPEQMRRIMGNIGIVLEAGGMDFSDVANCRVFLDDPRQFGAMNEAYREFFPEDPPSRATVEARLANPLFTAEVQCVASSAERSVLAPDGPRSGSPLSPGIWAGDRLYLSGMVAPSPRSEDAGEQTRAVLARLQQALEAGGLGFGDVVDAMVYLEDMRDYAAMNAAYREVVGAPFPPRATVETQMMGAGIEVEIMMTAER